MQELQIVLDKDSGRHFYEQIYIYIRDAIRQGSLRKGERLPSTRFLADSLDISRSTVQLAYEQLLSEGYIRSRRGSGYYVSPLEDILPVFEGKKEPVPRASEETKEDRDHLFPDSGIIDFSPRLIEMKQFPQSTWKKIHKGIFADRSADFFTSGDAAGDFPLRNTIAHYLQLSRGVNCGPEQVIVGAGTDYLLLLLGQILASEIRIGMESPTYLRAARIFDSLGWEVLGIPMDEQGMRADYLKKRECTAAYVMPAHQFPVGTLMPVARRMQILKWASEKEGRFIIEDDYDSEFRYRGKPVPSLQSMDRDGKVIYIGTFSKSIAPAIRVSYMILPPELLETYRKRCFFFSSTVSRIDQGVLNAFMAEGYFERYLNRMRTLYRTRHDVLIQELKALSPYFEISGAGAGHHIMVRETVSTGKETESEEAIEKDKIPKRESCLQKLALEEGVRVYPASEYRLPWEPFPPEQAVSAGFVLGYGGLSGEEIREGVRRLKNAWMPK